MNANTNLSPQQSHSKLPIIPRRAKFNYDDVDNADIESGNKIISAFWVGLSSTFPLGEAEFIRSVKLYERQITDDKLKQEVRDFAEQESHHATQHRKINKQFDSNGYDTRKVETSIEQEIKQRVSEWSPKKRLMRTVAAEHMTAVMAHYALSHPKALSNLPTSVRDLFLWHAIEEIEHKSVAFDVYKHCVGDMRGLRWHYVGFTFYEFPVKMFMITRFLLKDLGHKSRWQERKEMWRFLFAKNGMIGAVKHLYFQFLKKDFHPWQHDDSALVSKWKQQLSPYFKEH